MEIFILEPLVVGKLNLFSGIFKNDASLHREGLKGWNRDTWMFNLVAYIMLAVVFFNKIV